MVCTKCAKLSKGTTLATPAVKKKSELYHGSAASVENKNKSSSSATLGNTGVSKSKLLSKAAKNPFAMYSSSCTKCKAKVGQGHSYCHSCAYKADLCAVCGKANKKKAAGASVVTGQKFSLK